MKGSCNLRKLVMAGDRKRVERKMSYRFLIEIKLAIRSILKKYWWFRIWDDRRERVQDFRHGLPDWGCGAPWSSPQDKRTGPSIAAASSLPSHLLPHRCTSSWLALLPPRFRQPPTLFFRHRRGSFGGRRPCRHLCGDGDRVLELRITDASTCLKNPTAYISKIEDESGKESAAESRPPLMVSSLLLLLPSIYKRSWLQVVLRLHHRWWLPIIHLMVDIKSYSRFLESFVELIDAMCHQVLSSFECSNNNGDNDGNCNNFRRRSWSLSNRR